MKLLSFFTKKKDATKLWHIEYYPPVFYDGYTSAVIAAKSEEEASLVHPSGDGKWSDPFRAAIQARREKEREEEIKRGLCLYPTQIDVTFLGEIEGQPQQPVLCFTSIWKKPRYLWDC